MIGACVTVTASGQTLEECQQAAERNYPLIAQHDLIARTTDITLSNIQKGWLPQVTATAQATYQSAVTSWPDEMQSLMRTMGVEMQGLKRDQYKTDDSTNIENKAAVIDWYYKKRDESGRTILHYC